MSDENFQQLNFTRFRRDLSGLHKSVGSGAGRIEIVRQGSDDVCVLISKAELDGLERAIEILSASVEFRKMAIGVADVVADVIATGGPLVSRHAAAGN